VNDAVRELEVRYTPRLALNGRADASTRSLTFTCHHVVRKNLPVKFEEKGVQIGGDNYIILDNEGGVLRLINALLDEVEGSWNSYGR